MWIRPVMNISPDYNLEVTYLANESDFMNIFFDYAKMLISVLFILYLVLGPLLCVGWSAGNTFVIVFLTVLIIVLTVLLLLRLRFDCKMIKGLREEVMKICRYEQA